MTRALPQQRDYPGVDPALVRMTLEGLLEHYSARVASAESGAQVAQLVHDYAKCCLRELEGVQTVEGEQLRAHYVEMKARSCAR